MINDSFYKCEARKAKTVVDPLCFGRAGVAEETWILVAQTFEAQPQSTRYICNPTHNSFPTVVVATNATQEMTWTILHNCLQMIYFRVLGTLVFHLFFKKIIVTLVPFIFKENSKIVFVSIYLDFIAGKTNVCQIECYSIVNCNFFSSTVRQASGRYDDSILRQNYANFRP